MIAQPYEELNDLTLIALCIWREARGEIEIGKRGVAHVVANRVASPSWWGRDWRSVILKPYQFSSFNPSDPNNDKWPAATDASWTQCLSAASGVYLSMDDDPTSGAQFYHDISIDFPASWGNPAEYTNTLSVGRLKFYRHEKPNNALAVNEASVEG